MTCGIKEYRVTERVIIEGFTLLTVALLQKTRINFLSMI